MSTATEVSDDELGIPEEKEKTINIGLYIGGRNSKEERDGRGWAILPNGDQYDGQYRQGRRHGIGVYVFQNGSRYFGQYRCGYRSGRGIFVYPDGSHYEGFWRKNLKHGKGRYNYSNGDMYCGSWYCGLRHGVGIYTRGASTANANALSFKGTWRQGIRVGPFQLCFGTDEKCTTLHGTWDNFYPQGPCVFSFDSCYQLTGFFQTPGRDAWLALQAKKESLAEDKDLFVENDVLADEPSLWFAQDIGAYDYTLLPQEPVPLPISDSDVSVCSLSTVPTELTVEKPFPYMSDGGEEEGATEFIPCDEERSTSEIESSSQIYSPCTNPCDIDISKQKY